MARQRITRVECRCMDRDYGRADKKGRIYNVAVLTDSPKKWLVLYGSRNQRLAEWLARLTAQKLGIAVSGNIKGFSPALSKQAVVKAIADGSESNAFFTEMQRTVPKGYRLLLAGEPELRECANAAGSRDAFFAVRRNYAGLFLPSVLVGGFLLFCRAIEAPAVVPTIALVFMLLFVISSTGSATAVFERDD